MNAPTILLLAGALFLTVGEVWGIIRSDSGPDTITQYVKAVMSNKNGWIAVPGAILVAGGLIWALFHFFGVASLEVPDAVPVW